MYGRFVLTIFSLFLGTHPFARAETCGSVSLEQFISPTNTRNVVAITSMPVAKLQELNDCRLALGQRSNDLLACINQFYTQFRTDAISGARADLMAHMCAQNVAKGSVSLEKAAHAFSAQVLATKIQGDLLGIQGKLAMGEKLSGADLAYLQKVEKMTGIEELISEARKIDPAAARNASFDMKKEMEAKALPLRPHFAVLRRAGVKAGSAGISFKDFDFSRLRNGDSPEAQAMETIYGKAIVQQVRDTFFSTDPRLGRRAVVLGDTVVMPNRERADRSGAQSQPAVVSRSEYEKLISAAGQNFESRTLEYLKIAGKHDTHWEATKRFVPEYAKQWAMLLSDPFTAQGIDRAWEPETETERKLAPAANAMTNSLNELQLKFGLDSQSITGQLNFTLMALTEGRIKNEDAYRKVKHIAKAFGGTYLAAGIVATGGYLAYTFPAAGTFLLGATAETLTTAQISTAVMMGMTKMAGLGLGLFAVDGALTAAAKGSYGGGGFWCHIGEEMMNSQASALQFSAFAAVFPGASQAVKKLMILDNIAPQIAARLAPFLTAGILGSQTIAHAGEASRNAQDNFEDARELDELGDAAGARRKKHEGWVNAKNSLFPLLSIAATPLAGERLGPRPAARVESFPRLLAETSSPPRPPLANGAGKTEVKFDGPEAKGDATRSDGPDNKVVSKSARARDSVPAASSAEDTSSIPVKLAQALVDTQPSPWKSKLDEIWEKPELKDAPQPELIESTYPESHMLYKIKAKHGKLKPGGTPLDSAEAFNQMPDGEKFPFLLLPGEKALRYDGTVVGGHGKLADDQPIRTGGQMLKETLSAKGESPARVRVTFDNQSGHYHPPFATLRRAVEALWESGIYPDEILIKSWDSKGATYTIRLDAAGKPDLHPVAH